MLLLGEKFSAHIFVSLLFLLFFSISIDSCGNCVNLSGIDFDIDIGGGPAIIRVYDAGVTPAPPPDTAPLNPLLGFYSDQRSISILRVRCAIKWFIIEVSLWCCCCCCCGQLNFSGNQAITSCNMPCCTIAFDSAVTAATATATTATTATHCNWYR